MNDLFASFFSRLSTWIVKIRHRHHSIHEVRRMDLHIHTYSSSCIVRSSDDNTNVSKHKRCRVPKIKCASPLGMRRCWTTASSRMAKSYTRYVLDQHPCTQGVVLCSVWRVSSPHASHKLERRGGGGSGVAVGVSKQYSLLALCYSGYYGPGGGLERKVQ